MTRNATYREKGRAVFLAALMVMSVFAMAAALPGSAAAAHDGDATVNIDDDDRLYQGQTAVAQNVDPIGNGDTVDLYEGEDSDGEWVREVDVNDDGSLEIDTDTLNSGDHFVETGDDSDDLEFTIRVHTLDASLEDDRVTNVGDSSAATELTIDSPRANFHAEVSGENLDADDLRNIFDVDENSDENTNNGVVDVDDSEDVIVLEARGDYDLDFSDVDAGEYDLTIESVDTTAEDEVSIEVIDEEIEVAFTESTFVEERSNIAEVTVDLENTDTAYVSIGEEAEVNYDINVSVTDEDDDGEVTLFIDTTTAHTLEDGDNLNGEITAGDDDVTLEDVQAGGLSDPLEAGDYELAVATDAAFDNEQDTAYLTLEDREALAGDAVQTHTAPDSVSNSDELDDTTVTTTDQIANGDELLVTVETESLFAYFEDATTFDDVSNELYLEIEEQDSSPNADPAVWSTDTSNGDAEDISQDVTIVEADQSEGVVILSVDYDSFENKLENEQSYDVSFVVDENNDFVDNDETASDEFTVEEPYLEWDDAAEIVPNSEDAEVTGETNVAPGTEIETRARASGTFVLTEVVDVELNDDDQRVFAATYNFSEYEAGTEFELTAEAGELDDDLTATLVEAEEPEPELSIDADAPEIVDVDENATLDVTITNNGDAAANTTLEVTVGDDDYTEELELEAGETFEESYEFDTSAEGDIEWSVATDGVETAGTLTVEDAEENGEENGTENGEENGDENGTENGDEENGTENGVENGDENGDENGGEDESTPGFGVAVALAALMGAAMLALRRQN